MLPSQLASDYFPFAKFELDRTLMILFYINSHCIRCLFPLLLVKFFT